MRRILFSFFVFCLCFLCQSASASLSVKAGSDPSYCGDNVRLNVEPSWEIMGDNIFKEIHSVCFLNKDTGFIYGQNGALYRTTDGGETGWSRIPTNVPDNFLNLSFPTRNKGFIFTSSGYCLTSSNGGENWTLQDTGIVATLNQAVFPESTKGYGVDYSGNIFVSNDGGSSWKNQNYRTNTNTNYLSFVSADTGYIGGNNGTILKTIDGGKNWLNISDAITAAGPGLTSLCFINGLTGFAATKNGLYKTVDGGENWIPKLVNGNYTIAKIHFHTPDIGYAIEKNAFLMKTTDAGETWFYVLNSNNHYYDFCLTTGNTGYLIELVYTDSMIESDRIIYKAEHLTIDSCRWFPEEGLDNPLYQYPYADPSVGTVYEVIAYKNGESSTSTVTIDETGLTIDVGKDLFSQAGGAVKINIITTNFLGSESLKYKWTPSTGLDCDTIKNPRITPTADSITYTLTVETPNGCTASDSLMVIIKPLTLRLNIIESSGQGCGDTVVLSARSNYKDSPPLSYKWEPSTDLSSDTISQPTGIVNGITYIVTVTTPNGLFTAKDAITLTISDTPDVPTICLVSVNEANHNTLYWNRPEVDHADFYTIYKETNVTNNYLMLGTVPYDSIGIFCDTTSRPTVQSAKYRLTLTDLCGTETSRSAAHKTMHLSVNQGMNGSWNLIWEPYEGFPVTTYSIYRGSDPDNLSLIGSTSASSTQFSDLTPPTGTLFYQIEIISPNTFVQPVQTFVPLRSQGINSVRSNKAEARMPQSVNQLRERETFRMNPNPANNVVHIGIDGSFQLVNLYSLTGSLVKSLSPKDVNTELSVSELPDGLYIVEVRSDTFMGKQKLTIKH